jgi:hypothetical protein
MTAICSTFPPTLQYHYFKHYITHTSFSESLEIAIWQITDTKRHGALSTTNKKTISSYFMSFVLNKLRERINIHIQ